MADSRADIYLRVLTDGGEQTAENQRRKLRQFIEKVGYELAGGRDEVRVSYVLDLSTSADHGFPVPNLAPRARDHHRGEVPNFGDPLQALF